MSVINGFIYLKKHRMVFLSSTLIVLCQHFVSAVMIQMAFISLGNRIGFLEALVIGVFTAMSGFFSITPNNLGIQEGIMAGVGVTVGCEISIVVAASVYLRTVHLLCTIIATPFFIRYIVWPSRMERS